MATLPPHGNTQGQKRATRRWLAAIAILMLAVVLWLAGVGVFRLTSPKPATRAAATAPAALNTAADYLARGDYDYELGDYDRAIAAYSHAIEIKPDFAEAYNNRAYTYMTKKDYAHALPDLDQAIRLRPDYVNALMNRGDIYNYYYQIDYDRAISDYDSVLALDPDAAKHTSVCGHRMLALHHGWDLSIFGELFTRGAESGCPRESPAH